MGISSNGMREGGEEDRGCEEKDETVKVCDLWCTILLRPQMTGESLKMGYRKSSICSYVVEIL